MYRNLSITDFFKSFSQPRQKKRSPDTDLDDFPAAKRSRSSTPDHAANISPQDEAKEDHTGASSHAKSDALRRTASVIGGVIGSSPHGSEPLRPGSPPDKVEVQPIESQGPVLVSSQRMIVNGEIIIKNSDDESDSEASLDDIDALIVARKPALVLPTISRPDDRSSPDSTGKNRSVTRSKKKGTTSHRSYQRSSNPPSRPTYKYSLGSLKRQNKHHEAAEAGSVEAWSLLKSLEENASSQTAPQTSANEAQKIDADLVASVFKEKREDEDISRLMTAIRRTEAFHHGKIWSFFDAKNDQRLGVDFAVPNGLQIRWQKIMNDPPTRDLAFLGGFVGDMAFKKNLPDELLLWLFDAACLEPRADLRHSYAHTIEKTQTQITSLLTPTRIDVLFQRMGATPKALNIHTEIVPLPTTSPDFDVPGWSKLVSILNLLGRISAYLSIESRQHTLCILCRLLLDTSLVQSYEALNAIEFTFVNVLSSIPDKDHEHEIHEVLATVFPFVKDSKFRLQLLQNLPACSPRLVVFRRRLALAYFSHDEDYLTKSTSDLLDLGSIATELQHPRFAIRTDTDFSELAAVIGILSIGIDRGDPPSPHSDERQQVRFNGDVDLVASRIGEMFTSIVDTGASHMRRTEAKEMLEAFHSKLLYAVRTKPKPKTMLFGGSDALTQMQKGSFRSFFERKTDMHAQDV